MKKLTLLKTILLLTLVSFAYTAKAQKVAVSANKMNVLYIGVSNPLDVVVENMNCASFFVTTDNGTISGDSCNFKIRVVRRGRATIFVNKIVGKDTILIDKKEFRVKRVPAPIAKIGNRKSGTISKHELIAHGGITAALENFYYEARVHVSNYKVVLLKEQKVIFEKDIEGNIFTKEIKTEIRKLQTGDTVRFENIYYIWSGYKREVRNTIEFTIK